MPPGFALALVPSTPPHLHPQVISERDVEEAIAKVSILGSGFKIFALDNTTNGLKLVQSVPMELTVDNTAILALAQGAVERKVLQFQGSELVVFHCFLTVEAVQEALAWPAERCVAALDHLMQTGMAWADVDKTYWFPTFCCL